MTFKRYTEEFREEAVRQVTQRGYPVSEVSESLGIRKQYFELRNDVMAEKKIWFKGINRRLWIPISIEGWGVTALFFIGLFLMKKMNDFSPDANLTITQIFTVIVEFAVLLGILYFVTKGHVDKKY